MEREREQRERDHKKHGERPAREIEWHRPDEKHASSEKDRSRGRRGDRRGEREEEQWKRRGGGAEGGGGHDSRKEGRHGDKRWQGGRERSPVREKPQPLPLMEIKVERPKPRSPSSKNEGNFVVVKE